MTLKELSEAVALYLLALLAGARFDCSLDFAPVLPDDKICHVLEGGQYGNGYAMLLTTELLLDDHLPILHTQDFIDPIFRPGGR